MKLNPDDIAARQTQLPKMTKPMGSKVRGSANVADAIDRVDNGVPREGDARSITSMKPVGAGRHRGYD
jgi:hypothetical protein